MATRRGTARPRDTETQRAQGKSAVYTRRGKEDETEKVDVFSTRVFDSEPAYVRVAAGVTRNMGNYESLRVDVSVTLPCYPDEVDQSYTEVSEKVASMLDKELSSYLDE